MAAELIRFSLVGALGFVVDTAVLYVCLFGGGLGFYVARLISFLSAATVTWSLNRKFTFRFRQTDQAHHQWARFVLVNSAGGAVNYGVYATMIANGAPFTTYPVIGVAAGSLSGLAFNFVLSRAFVFRRT